MKYDNIYLLLLQTPCIPTCFLLHKALNIDERVVYS